MNTALGGRLPVVCSKGKVLSDGRMAEEWTIVSVEQTEYFILAATLPQADAMNTEHIPIAHGEYE